jgi:hypothetical protein
MGADPEQPVQCVDNHQLPDSLATFEKRFVAT